MRTHSPCQLASPEHPLLLDAATLARITEGQWRNLPGQSQFTGVSFQRKYMAQGATGNLYFSLAPHPRHASFHADTLQDALNAFQDGAAAVVVAGAVQDLPTDWPLLLVDDVVEALDRLAFEVRDHLFKGKRVLVSGIHGSNLFKNMLQQVLSPQMPTHALAPAADVGAAIVSSLASLRQSDLISVIEASAQPAGRLAIRSGYVRPHLAVITAICAADESPGQDQIDAYADVSTGLNEGGFCLINADSQGLEPLQRAILSRRRVPLVLFGSAAHCPGRLLAQRFTENQWLVTAVIEGQTVQYPLALVDAAAPLLSVAVLLTAYYLGADVALAAQAMANLVPDDRHSTVRKIACRGGVAELFAGQELSTPADWQAFFQSGARLTTRQTQGRKLAVLGATAPKSGQRLPDPTSLAQGIDAVQADLLVLVGANMAAVQPLLLHPERVVKLLPELGRRHSGSLPVQTLIDTVQDLLQPGDLLLVGGHSPELLAHWRAGDAATPSAQPAMQDLPALPAIEGVNFAHPVPYFQDKDGIRRLHIGSTRRQSIMRLDEPDSLVWEYTRQMMGWLLFVDPDSVTDRHAMQLGLGAGSLTKACRNRLGMRTTAVELNPAVIALCKTSFFLPPEDDRLQVISDDAARQLRAPQWQAAVDALQVDLFDEHVNAPVFDSEAFFADCRAVLTRDGCLTFNIVGRASSVDTTFNHMSRVFGRLALWSFARCSTGNTVVMAQRLPSRPSYQTLQSRAREIQRRWGFSATEWVDSLESLVA